MTPASYSENIVLSGKHDCDQGPGGQNQEPREQAAFTAALIEEELGHGLRRNHTPESRPSHATGPTWIELIRDFWQGAAGRQNLKEHGQQIQVFWLTRRSLEDCRDPSPALRDSG